MLKGRTTVQKKAIARVLRKGNDHPCASDVHEGVRKILPGISLATVYRNLEIMADSGFLTRIPGTRECRYDTDTSPHHHLICLECRNLVDLPIHAAQVRLTDPCTLNGCTIKEAQLILLGYCGNCGSA